MKINLKNGPQSNTALGLRALGHALAAIAVVAVLVPVSAHAGHRKAARNAEVATEPTEMLPPKLVVDAAAQRSALAAEATSEQVGAAEPAADAKTVPTEAAGPVAQDAAVAETSGKGVDVDTALAQAKRDSINRLPENEIPVLTKNKDEKKDAGGGLTRIFLTLGVLVVVFGAASFGLKRWAARSAGGRNQNTRIRVLTQHHLGPKKTLAIVQVAGESILIGITDHNIAMLKTLSLIDDEVPAEVPNSFAGAMTDLEFDEDPDDSGSNFAFRGLSEIRDVVSRGLGAKR